MISRTSRMKALAKFVYHKFIACLFMHVSSCSHCFFQNDDFHFADAKKTSKVSRLHHRQKWQVQSSYPRHPPRLLTEP